MKTEPKRDKKLFPFHDGTCTIVFVGSGAEVTPEEMERWVERHRPEAMRLPARHALIVEMERWVEKYRPESMRLPARHALIVDYDRERGDSPAQGSRP